MTEAARGSSTAWLQLARQHWLWWGGVACYVLASPFLALITWSAGQVWLGGMATALDGKHVGAIAAVWLARHHAIPFAIFGVVSLTVAFVGGALLRRADRQRASQAREDSA